MNHRWAEKIVVSPYKTERECKNGCGIVKVIRHEGQLHWMEFYCGLDRIECTGTPPCTGKAKAIT